MYYSDHFAVLGRYQAPSFNQNPEDTKWMFSVGFQGKSFNATVIQVSAMTRKAEETEIEWFYEDL